MNLSDLTMVVFDIDLPIQPHFLQPAPFFLFFLCALSCSPNYHSEAFSPLLPPCNNHDGFRKEIGRGAKGGKRSSYGQMWVIIYSFIYPVTHQLIQSLIHSLTLSLLYSPTSQLNNQSLQPCQRHSCLTSLQRRLTPAHHQTATVASDLRPEHRQHDQNQEQKSTRSPLGPS